MLGDLEFRGCARPITEEYNLAANYNQDDVLQAEYYRTFASNQFLGGNILRLLRSQKKTSSAEITHYTFFRKRVGYTKKKGGFEAPWEQKYGFRGDHSGFYYLSPWEFTQWWFCDRLGSPTSDKRTEWTEEGLAFKARNADVPPKLRESPTAGLHYRVKDSLDLTLFSNR